MINLMISGHSTNEQRGVVLATAVIALPLILFLGFVAYSPGMGTAERITVEGIANLMLKHVVDQCGIVPDPSLAACLEQFVIAGNQYSAATGRNITVQVSVYGGDATKAELFATSSNFDPSRSSFTAADFQTGGLGHDLISVKNLALVTEVYMNTAFGFFYFGLDREVYASAIG
jgi:hypothetical protein